MEVFGSGIADRSGWVEVEASTLALNGSFLAFDSALSSIDGAELTKPSAQLVFPNIIISGQSNSTISYVHVGSEGLRLASMSLYDNSGKLVDRSYISLEALSGFSGPITKLFPAVGSSDGYAVLESAGTPFTRQSETLVGLETHQDRSDMAILKGVPGSQLLRQGYLAHLVSGGGYRTRLGLVNYTSESQTVNISALDLEANGQAIQSVNVTRTMPAFGRLEENAEDLFRLGDVALTTGYVRYNIEGSTPGLIGYAEYGTNNGTMLSAAHARETGFSDLFFSHVAEGPGFYTGMTLLNPNTQTASVTLDVFSRTGQRTASRVLNVAGEQRLVGLMSELFSGFGDQLGGYIHITSFRPILALQFLGSRVSPDFLANVAAQGVMLQPQASGRVVKADRGANIIATDGSASIAIPPEALATDTEITVGAVSIATLPPPSALESIVAAVQTEPSGTRFEIPVKLTFPLAAQLPPGDQVQILMFNPTTKQFEPTEFVGIAHTSGRTISSDVTHFTTFAVALPKVRLLDVTGVIPQTGLPGTEVTIEGSGFRSDPADNTVTFAGIDNTAVVATVLSASPTRLTVSVPVGANTGNLIVKVGGKTSVGQEFRVPLDNPVPSLVSLTPKRTPLGSASVELLIVGTDFGADSAVMYDGVLLATTYVDSTLLLVSVSGPLLNPGVHRVTVSNPLPGGGESRLVEFIVDFPLPVVTRTIPTKAEAGARFDITILGAGFTVVSVLLVDGLPLPTRYVNPATLLATVGPLPEGVHKISVLNPSPGGGISNISKLDVSLLSKLPSLASIEPSKAFVGEAVTVLITGANLGGENPTVSVSGEGITIGSVSVVGEAVTTSFSIARETTAGMRTVTVAVDDQASNSLPFVLRGPGPSNESSRFAVFGDYGYDTQAELDVANLVKTWDVDFIITTGDNNYNLGAADSIDRNVGKYYHDFIFPYLGDFGSGATVNRFFPSLGNHDWNTAGAVPYLDYFTLPGNERYYDFVWGDAHFFAIDSDFREPDGDFIDVYTKNPGSTQGRWLEQNLTSSTSCWNIVYMHHPPYTSHHHGNQTWMQWPYQDWGADVVMAGHDHAYERLIVDGLTYFVVGTGGNGL